MSYSEKELQEHYQQLDDDKIVKLAKKESKSLQEFVIPILKNEIYKRSLNTALIDWINFERNFFKGQELKNLKLQIENTICSQCKITSKIQGAEIKYFIAFLDTYDDYEIEVLLCENCIQKLRRKSYIKTITFGWFSSWGIIKVPFYFFNEFLLSFQRKKNHHQIIEKFIFENTGNIRKNGIENVAEIISKHNQKQLQNF